MSKLTETIAEFLVELFGETIPAELTIFVLSMMPILELRGGLFAATLLDVELWKAFIICFIGNMVPIPFIVLFIKKIFAFMRRFKAFGKIVDKLEAKAYKNKDKVMRYQEWGLFVFVAIPLPGTGGWTGALIAAMLGLDTKKSIFIIALGVLVAGIIVATLFYGTAWLLGGHAPAETESVSAAIRSLIAAA